MSCYFIAQISILDRPTYHRYEDGLDPVLETYNGTVVAVDDHPVLLEGTWSHGRFVIIRFPDAAEARRWYDSSEYRELSALRKRAARADVLFVEGRD